MKKNVWEMTDESVRLLGLWTAQLGPNPERYADNYQRLMPQLLQAIADLPPRPKAHHHWVPGRGRFVPPPPPLQPAEAAAAARIAARRAAADPGNPVAAAVEAAAEAAAEVASIDLKNLFEEEDMQSDASLFFLN